MTFLSRRHHYHPLPFPSNRFTSTLCTIQPQNFFLLSSGCHPLHDVTGGGPPLPLTLVTPLNHSSVATKLLSYHCRTFWLWLLTFGLKVAWPLTLCVINFHTKFPVTATLCRGTDRQRAMHNEACWRECCIITIRRENKSYDDERWKVKVHCSERHCDCWRHFRCWVARWK